MPYPDILRSLFSYQKAAALTSPNLVSFDCVIPGGFYGKYVMLMALPLVAILLSGVLALALRKIVGVRERRRTLSMRFPSGRRVRDRRPSAVPLDPSLAGMYHITGELW